MEVVKILKYAKETSSYYRWDLMVDDTNFELYIPKWRVPQPCPLELRVTISSVDEIDQGLLETKELKPRSMSPIIAKIGFTEEKTKTIRYDPVLEYKDREIGSPHIPMSFLPAEAPLELVITVEWLTK